MHYLTADILVLLKKSRDSSLLDRRHEQISCIERRNESLRDDCNNVGPHSSLGNTPAAEARRALEQSVGSAPGALTQPETDDYQSQGLSYERATTETQSDTLPFAQYW